MTPKDILLVNDEYPVREMLALGLNRDGFTIREAGTASEAYARMAKRLPHLLLVDWMLPDMSGLELVRGLKADRSTRAVPVIILSAWAAERNRMAALESGADDYVTKPFSLRELVARIQTVLGWGGDPEVEPSLALSGLTLEPASHRVFAGERVLPVGPVEYRLLEFFMRHPERAHTRPQLLHGVWSQNICVDERTVDVHIRRLRRVLGGGNCASLIQTVRGVGYRFAPRVNGSGVLPDTSRTSL